ncbi:MAG: CehA/McbA family metallohydrolase [Polyangiaceae bacterium]
MLFGPRVARSLTATFFVASAGCGSAPSATQAPRAAVRLEAPRGVGTVEVITSLDQVPLRGPRVEAKVGDYLVRGEGLTAVVSRDDGMLLDYGPEGDRDDLVSYTPSILDGLSAARTAVTFLGPAADAPWALHAEYRASGINVTLHAFFTFRDGALIVETTAVADPGSDGMVVGIGERMNFGNVPSWVEGAGFLRHDGGAFNTRFVAREAGPTPGSLAYAVGPDAGGDFFVRFGTAYLPGYFQAGRGSALVTARADGSAERRTLRFFAGHGSLGAIASRLLPKSARRTLTPKLEGAPRGTRIEIAACADEKRERSREPYARFAAGEDIEVPVEGCFEARLWAPGHVATKWSPVEDLEKGALALAPAGAIAVAVTLDGHAGPARVQVRGVDGTPDPDWGEDPDDGAALNTFETTTGFMTMPVPPGKYRVIVDRGFEYTASIIPIQVRANDLSFAAAKLTRAVDTTGWVSADLHLHSHPSFDAPNLLEDRVRSLAAAGVEVGVATDHNRVTDYRPAIQALALGDYVAPIIGDEVTTEDTQFGHFNVFPLDAGSEPLGYEHTSPRAIFDEARSRAPLRDGVVIQVNHPRMGDIGYLEVLRMDREELPAWQARTPWAPLDFDLIELYNGDEAAGLGSVRANMKDWLNLLDEGRRLTATGNSDSHRIAFHEPGLPRNYVAVSDDTPKNLDVPKFARALHEGRVVVSGGPFLRLDIDGATIGDTVSPGTHVAVVTVDAPPWMDISYVELVQRGKVVGRLAAPFPAAATANHRVELRVPVELADGDWVIAVTGGDKEMEPLLRRGVLPFAFTNPVRVSSSKP